jgi:hypothetical protein
MWSKGITWIDDCRIPFVDENTSRKQTPVKVEVYGWSNHKGQIGSFDDTWQQGRFPANLLVSDDMLNDGVISKSQDKSKGNIRKSLINGADNAGGFYRPDYFVERNGFNDKGTNSRYYDIDKWFDKILND